MKIVFALLLVACGDPPGGAAARGGDGGAGDAGGAHGITPPIGAPTFSAVYRDVIVGGGCVLGLCHGEGASGGGLDLDPKQTAYDELVGAPTTGGECVDLGLLRVEPGAPERSLLVSKLAQDPACGFMMPPDGPLAVERVRQVEEWIRRDAPND